MWELVFRISNLEFIFGQEQTHRTSGLASQDTRIVASELTALGNSYEFVSNTSPVLLCCFPDSKGLKTKI